MSLAAHLAVTLRIVHGRAYHKAEHAAGLVVKLLGADLSLADKFQIRTGHVIVVICVARTVGESVGPASELKVKTIGDSLTGVVCATPVADNRSVEPPFFLEDVVEHTLIVTEMLIFVVVVCTHYRPCFAFLYGSLEGGEINLVESAVIHNNVCGVAVQLVVVESEVLHTCRHAAILKTLHVGHYHNRGEIWILAHILEVSAVHRCAVDVYTGAEQHIFSTVSCFLADRLAI